MNAPELCTICFEPIEDMGETCETHDGWAHAECYRDAMNHAAEGRASDHYDYESGR